MFVGHLGEILEVSTSLLWSQHWDYRLCLSVKPSGVFSGCCKGRRKALCTGRGKALTKEMSKKRPEGAVKGFDLRTQIKSSALAYGI